MSKKSVVQNAQTNNAKFVSIIPENGNEFSPGQKIVFNLDPSIGWVKGRDSYLVFEIENVSRHLMLTLRSGGISSVIKQVNIFSAQNGMLLESLDNYNQWTSCEMEYSHDDPVNLTNIEGCPKSIASKRAIGPVTYHNWGNNYSQPESHRLTQLNNDCTEQATPVRFCTPLRCGIFRHWDSESLVPVLQMGGLRIELVLAPSIEVTDLAYTTNKPFNMAPVLQLFASFSNSNPLDATTLEANFGTTVTPQEVGLMVGNNITISYTTVAGAATTHDAVITAMDATGAQNRPKITFNPGLAVANDGDNATVTLNATSLTETNIGYKIKSCEFRLLQEMPPDDKMKNIEYVFTSYNLFRDSIPQTQVNFNQDVTSVASKAVSLFTMYEDPQYDTMARWPAQHYTQGLAPDETGVNLNSIVYFINNKLYPLRAYNPQGKADKVINQNEVVKAFGTLNIPVKSLGINERGSLDIYSNRYLHARELARGNSVFNLQNAEPQIRVGFSAPRGQDKYGNQIGNIKMNTYVFSKKVLTIDGENGLSLEH